MLPRLLQFLLLLTLFVAPAFVPAQTPLRGRIVDAGTANELVGASVTVKGTVRGTITDSRGVFAMKVSQRPPFVVLVSAIGYRTKEYIIKPGQTVLNVAMEEEQKLGQELISSASRMEESVLRSPVSVEKVNLQAIQASPTPTVYESLGYLKGVSLNRQSVLFQAVGVRGFASSGNVRLVQLSDGMDNQSPGLNFSVGNLVGPSELDLESMELLPGAASALYGPNAVNGLLLMTSKSPFRYQGLSAQVKTGVMRASNRTVEETPLYEGSIRYAKAFGNKVALKVSATYLKATDWQATDYRNQSLSNGKTPDTGSLADLDYDGVNIYGDASVNVYSALRGNGIPGNGTNGTSAALGLLASTQIPQLGNRTLPQLTGLMANQLFDIVVPQKVVARPGYRENELVDYSVDNLKLSAALHYRLNSRIEAILQANYGTGSTFYTAQERYAVKNMHLGQYKAELRGPTFFVRGYYSHEDAGDSFALSTLGQGINEAGTSSATWFNNMLSTYAQTAFTGYASSYVGALSTGATPADALLRANTFARSQQNAWLEQARALADQNRLQPGTPAFQQAYNEVINRTLPGDFSGVEPKVGARFIIRTASAQGEFMYDFRRLIKPKKLELLMGGNFRQYNLNSAGTLFALDDAGREFRVHEYGGYVQAGRNFANVLKLTGSLRYDKNQNFEGQFSPRLAAVLSLGKDRQHNIRASLQQGFRIPTLQAQYSDVLTPTFRYIGGLPFLKDRYNFAQNPVYTLESVTAFEKDLMAGRPITEARRQLQPFPTTFKWNPEVAQTIEVGYKALLGQRLLIDAYYFYNRLLNFEGTQVGFQDASVNGGGFPLSLVSDATRKQYTFPVNLPNDIALKNHGWAVSAELPLPGNFLIGGNVAFNALLNGNEIPQGFVSFYNTPCYQYNLSVANRNLFNSGFSFNVVYHYQDGTVWAGAFAPTQTTAAQQTLVPGFQTLDAQLSKKILPIRSIIKVGGTNLLNQLYTQAWGNPSIGATYYVSLTFDELLN
jgi:iron complex outermembrane recepter protein